MTFSQSVSSIFQKQINGLRQLVQKPTRFDNLLDLSVTDIESAHATVSAKIGDHAVVTTSLNLALPKISSHSRKVWSYAKADWIGLKVTCVALIGPFCATVALREVLR